MKRARQYRNRAIAMLHVVFLALAVLVSSAASAGQISPALLTADEISKIHQDIEAMIATSVYGADDFVVREASKERMQIFLGMPEFSRMSSLEKSNALIFAGRYDLLTFTRISDIGHKMAAWYQAPAETDTATEAADHKPAWLSVDDVILFGPSAQWATESSAFLLVWNCMPRVTWMHQDRFPFAKFTAAELGRERTPAETAIPVAWTNAGNQHDLQFGACIQEMRQSHAGALPNTAEQRQDISTRVEAFLLARFAQQLERDACSGSGADDCVMLLLLWSDLKPDDPALAQALKRLEPEIALAQAGSLARQPAWSNAASPEGDKALRDGAFLRAKTASIVNARAQWPAKAKKELQKQIANWQRWRGWNVAPGQRYDISARENSYADPAAVMQKRKRPKPSPVRKKIPVAAQTVTPPREPVFDSEAHEYAQILWADPLNPSFLLVGEDQLLVKTTTGIAHWDINSRQLESISNGPYPMDRTELLNAARIKNGAIVVISSAWRGSFLRAPKLGPESVSLAQWDAAQKKLSTVLPWSRDESGVLMPELLSLDDNHVLVCAAQEGKASARILESSPAGLAWQDSSSEALVQVLQRNHVEGMVMLGEQGMGITSAAPVSYNTSTCSWSAKAGLPEGLDPHDTAINTPHFLSDGRIILDNVRNKKLASDFPRLLIWLPDEKRWSVASYSTASRNRQSLYAQTDDNIWRDAGDYLEKLDVESLRWERSQQKINRKWADLYSVLPLTGNRALVMNRNINSSAPEYSRSGSVAILSLRKKNNTPPLQLAFDHASSDIFPLRSGRVLLLGDHVELLDSRSGKARELPPLPENIRHPAVLEKPDQSLWVFAGLPRECKWNRDEDLVDPSRCPDAGPVAAFHLSSAAKEWSGHKDMAIAFAHGTDGERRSDAVVNRNGSIFFLDNEGAQVWAKRQKDHDYRRGKTRLMRWSSGATAGKEAVAVANLAHARRGAALLALPKGRYAVAGGQEQILKSASPGLCQQSGSEDYCPYVVQEALSTEIIDADKGLSRFGPVPNFAGGQIAALGNGRTVKISEKGCPHESGFCLEVIDRNFRHWKKLPSPPLKERFYSSKIISVGNSVLLINSDDRKHAILEWNDNRKRWRQIKSWPKKPDWWDILPAGPERVFMLRPERSFSVERVRHP